MSTTPTPVQPATHEPVKRLRFRALPTASYKNNGKWTASYKTPYLRQLPFRVTPFVLGVMLQPHHLRPFAEAMCPPEIIELERHNYHAALVAHMFEKREEQTFIPVPDPDTNETVYLWVQVIIPGYDDEVPEWNEVSTERCSAFCRYLAHMGLSKDIIEELKLACSRWPERLLYPAWLPAKLEGGVRQQIEAAKERKSAAAAEAEIMETAATNVA